MEKPCLNDQEEYPHDEVLERYLGEAKAAWDAFFDLIVKEYPEFMGEWRYYNDGKSWLYKITQKKKTISWVSVYPGMFKTTFYFPARAEEIILKSKLKKEYKDAFVNGKWYGKTRGLTIDVKKIDDLDATKILMKIKEKLK